MRQQTLQGIRVLDFSTYLAGPYGATLLADLGAEVLKIEPPGGEAMRQYPSTLPGESRYHLGVNRNKRGIVIDLKKAMGRDVCHNLVSRSDVVIHNFRPDVPARIGLDFTTLCEVNPRIVCCSITGYGSSGPLAQKPGFDQVLQCFSGIAHAQGADRGEPSVVWGSAVDYYAASMVAMSVCAALFDRERTGKPQLVEASLLRSALAMQAGRLVWAEGESRDVERDLKPGRLSGIHPTKEGHLYLQANSQPFWIALCELIGLDHLARDPRYDSVSKRKDLEAELLPQLRQALAGRTAVEWERVFGTRVPCAVVARFEDMFDHPQVVSQGMVAEFEHPVVGRYRTVAGPVQINAEGGGLPTRRAPLVGEHTREVLREVGYRADQIEALLEAGAIA